MRFSDPSTLPEVDSDLHQAYFTWLCGTFRLSQPPGTLLRLQPAGLITYRNAPGLFEDLQRTSPSGSHKYLAAPSAPLVLHLEMWSTSEEDTHNHKRERTPGIRASRWSDTSLIAVTRAEKPTPLLALTPLRGDYHLRS